MTPRSPWLLYVYPWMPYPRRVTIYLRERKIPSSTVRVVPVSIPDNKADEQFPPRPPGSLPILAVPDHSEGEVTKPQSYTYIGQSLAILNYLEDACEVGLPGFPPPQPSFRGTDALSRARIREMLSVADECTSSWNPVRMFGTGTGTMSYPQGAKEMLRWVRRLCMTAERQLNISGRDLDTLKQGAEGEPTIADIVLYQFLEFTKECYGVDMSIGTGKMTKDVYGRDALEEYPALRKFYLNFKTRDSVQIDAGLGEIASEEILKKMQTWADGVLED